MAFIPQAGEQFQQAALRLGPRAGLLMLAAALFAATAFFVPPGQGQWLLVLVAATLGGVALWVMVVTRGINRRAKGGRQAVAHLAQDMLEADPVPLVLTGGAGHLIHANAAARRLLAADRATSLVGALREVLANPEPILFRMEARALAKGAAVEDLVTRGGHLRIGVHRSGDEHFLWRIEKSTENVPREAEAQALPMLTLGRRDAVLFMNAAARDLVGERVRTLDRLCVAPPLRPGAVNDIATPDGPMPCLVVVREGMAGRREMFLLPGVEGGARALDGWAFFDALPVPLLKVSARGLIQLSNRPARELLGVESVTALSLGDTLEGLGRSITDWLGDAAAGRGTVHAEFLRVRRQDREVFVQVTLNRTMEGDEPVLIAVLSDATELKTLEAQFVQSQKMQAIGQLAGGVAHDFNNLLTAISGHCDLLLLRHDQGDPDYGDLMQINQNANRAAALVSQLLAYSRKQTLRPEVIDLRDTLADLTHLLNRLVGEKISLSLSHDPTLAAIRADKRQLEQVLMNLVVNSRDAMPAGGEIRIVTHNLTLTEALCRDRAVVQPGRYVSVQVIDAGAGIAPDKLQKVFEPFFTTKRTGEGTGLGLSTAYGIVKQTGGFIFVDSTLGEGTCFQLLFPAYLGEPQSVREVPRLAVSETRGCGVVLLVEDEAPVRAFASRALQLRGFTVLEAESAEDALEILEDPDLQVDVFVTDVVMPGIDGPGWVRRALTTRPAARVVFMSGYAEETFGDRQACIPQSVFLPKPFSLNELTETVQRQLR
ncbi:multi-sensor hybrid histidine kinase [Roseovarius sp. TM1035]|uniref:hybrid sensor histidine kinase/response regulator n=1 Tax=Roseovarius sp. TM1035 TaxID=391613 RepID=UPI0001557807|nr:Sensory box histidine kinase/response regulator [Roseovarius sp. AK1035]EDM32013.1 multi-sensor hybrid histidine kinase [Roseovarius sp. TM1035]